MATDIEEVNKIIKEKGIKTAKETFETVQSIVKEQKFFKKNAKKMIQVRGKVIEASTHIEETFNQIIINMSKQELFGAIIQAHVLLGKEFIDNVDKNLYDPKYATELQYKNIVRGKVTDSFSKKAGYVKNIIQRYVSENKFFTKDFMKKYDKLVSIRNRFAHVPISSFSKNLEFSSEKHYEDFFKDEQIRDVKIHFDKFGQLYEEILTGLQKFLIEFIDSRLSNNKEVDLGFKKE